VPRKSGTSLIPLRHLVALYRGPPSRPLRDPSIVTGVTASEHSLVSNFTMTRIPWRWSLALLQTALATAALLYAPYQYRAGRHAIGDDAGLVVWRQTYPPAVLRIAYAMNFPALAATYPLRFAGNWAVRPLFRWDDPFVWISVDDAIFLLGVGALWYWVGAGADRIVGWRGSVHSRALRATGATIGLSIAVGIAVLAVKYSLLTDADRPFKQIGVIGVIWSIVLLCYFSWKLVLVIRASTPSRRQAA
jgi:hypothetical protein